MGGSTTIAFRASREGSFAYFDTLPGRRSAGMEGAIRIVAGQAEARVVQRDVAQDPANLPRPLDRTAPQRVHVELGR